jgi:hypothetical protein
MSITVTVPRISQFSAFTGNKIFFLEPQFLLVLNYIDKSK